MTGFTAIHYAAMAAAALLGYTAGALTGSLSNFVAAFVEEVRGWLFGLLALIGLAAVVYLVAQHHT